MGQSVPGTVNSFGGTAFGAGLTSSAPATFGGQFTTDVLADGSDLMGLMGGAPPAAAPAAAPAFSGPAVAAPSVSAPAFSEAASAPSYSMANDPNFSVAASDARMAGVTSFTDPLTGGTFNVADGSMSGLLGGSDGAFGGGLFGGGSGGFADSGTRDGGMSDGASFGYGGGDNDNDSDGGDDD
jgi:hypothetical protein